MSESGSFGKFFRNALCLEILEVVEVLKLESPQSVEKQGESDLEIMIANVKIDNVEILDILWGTDPFPRSR